MLLGGSYLVVTGGLVDYKYGTVISPVWSSYKVPWASKYAAEGFIDSSRIDEISGSFEDWGEALDVCRI